MDTDAGAFDGALVEPSWPRRQRGNLPEIVFKRPGEKFSAYPRSCFLLGLADNEARQQETGPLDVG
jgi:hypothetical protein